MNKNQSTQLYHETDYFTVQIIDKNANSTNQAVIKTSDSYPLSIINYTSCEALIKQKINVDTNLISSQIDFRKNYDNGNETFINIGAVNYNLFNPNSGRLLDIASLCKEEPIIVKMPIQDPQLINKTIYEEFQGKGINIFDKKSEFYNSRCFPFIMNVTNQTVSYDMTVNKRREEFFQNISISCGQKCDFIAIDTNNYTVCNCLQVTDIKIWFDKLPLLYFNSLNIDIFLCFRSINWVT